VLHCSVANCLLSQRLQVSAGVYRGAGGGPQVPQQVALLGEPPAAVPARESGLDVAALVRHVSAQVLLVFVREAATVTSVPAPLRRL
jgi:hypothetical protein